MPVFLQIVEFYDTGVFELIAFSSLELDHLMSLVKMPTISIENDSNNTHLSHCHKYFTSIRTVWRETKICNNMRAPSSCCYGNKVDNLSGWTFRFTAK